MTNAITDIRYHGAMSAPQHPYQSYPPPQAPRAPKPKTPWWKQPVIVILGVGLLGFIGGAMAAQPPTENTAVPAPTVTATTTITAEPEPAPTVTITQTVTAQPETPAEPEPADNEPDAEPASNAGPPEGDALAEAVSEALGIGTEWEPTWATPITELEGRGDDELWVYYQEALTDAEKVELAQFIFNFARAVDIDLDTIVVTDTGGINFNVWCGRTICADSLWDIDG